LAPDFSLVTPEMIAACHEAKLPVYVWTVDKKEDMERMVHLGVDAILSNDVPLLNATLNALGESK
jgi:glycerophosphoryl diester phosphodiesterase